MQRKVWNKGIQRLRIGRISLSGHIYFVTTVTKKRRRVFNDAAYAQAAVDAFAAPALLKDSCILSWVLMPDHAHWLIQLGSQGTLSSLVASMKSASARQVRRAGYEEVVWAKGFYDSRLRHNLSIPIVTRYILNNPLKAGLATERGQYQWCYPRSGSGSEGGLSGEAGRSVLGHA